MIFFQKLVFGLKFDKGFLFKIHSLIFGDKFFWQHNMISKTSSFGLSIIKLLYIWATTQISYPDWTRCFNNPVFNDKNIMEKVKSKFWREYLSLLTFYVLQFLKKKLLTDIEQCPSSLSRKMPFVWILFSLIVNYKFLYANELKNVQHNIWKYFSLVDAMNAERWLIVMEKAENITFEIWDHWRKARKTSRGSTEESNLRKR
jgi:hypothetical protein